MIMFDCAEYGSDYVNVAKKEEHTSEGYFLEEENNDTSNKNASTSN